MQCEGVIPEQRVPIDGEMVETAPAQVERRKLQDAEYADVETAPAVTEDRVIDDQLVTVVVEPARHERREIVPEVWHDVVLAPAQYERVVHYETTPEHPCDREATMVARSMKQVRCDVGELHWVRDGKDRAYCALCYVDGTMTHEDGSVSRHGYLSIADYREG
jgi:hypothetical protein